MFGLRPDGKKIKNLDPIQRLMPHIMSARHDSQNLCEYDVRCEPFDEFIKKQREVGEKFNYMHLVIAGIVRTIAQYPRLNRFIMNGRIFQRKGIYVSFVVKKNLSASAADSTVKILFTGKETIYEICDLIYHVMVLMVEAGISLKELFVELASRRIIDFKIKQESSCK